MIALGTLIKQEAQQKILTPDHTQDKYTSPWKQTGRTKRRQTNQSPTIVDFLEKFEMPKMNQITG